MAPLLLHTFLFLFPAVGILREKTFQPLPAGVHTWDSSSSQRPLVQGVSSRSFGKSLWRHQAVMWRSKVNCQSHSQSCLWSGGLCSSVPLRGANVLLEPLTDSTGSKPRNFSEGDSRGNYSCHPKLVIYLFTQAAILGRCWTSLPFCRLPDSVSPPTPGPPVTQRKGHVLSPSLAFGKVFFFFIWVWRKYVCYFWYKRSR